MLQKIRTPVIDVAFKASSIPPPDVQRTIEWEFSNFVLIFTSAVMRGKDEKFFTAIREFILEEMREMREILGEYDARTTKPCEDWTRGLRSPSGACTNCGREH